ncbi:hypothetical protein ACFRC1_28390 [Streptomyces sp. NPDC056626]|uniref:hypothetical protein n=1 Tax=Streptomyces sp. NPDC056626 TaxID=3345880 RepID=UPI00268BE7AC
MNESLDPPGAGSRNRGGARHRASHLRLVHDAGRRPASSDYQWAELIAERYGLTLAEARAELRRLAGQGWQSWEFDARFALDRKDPAA